MVRFHLRRFEAWAISSTPLCPCLWEETLKAVGPNSCVSSRLGCLEYNYLRLEVRKSHLIKCEHPKMVKKKFSRRTVWLTKCNVFRRSSSTMPFTSPLSIVTTYLCITWLSTACHRSSSTTPFTSPLAVATAHVCTRWFIAVFLQVSTVMECATHNADEYE